MTYNFLEIEQKWQSYWAKNKTFRVLNSFEKPKYYVLDMFPYPSGAGLHVGHPLGYIASDIYARYKRHMGYNVLHPMGYDSFGLPAEQYAIQTGQHPAITTEKNINRYREQLDKMGFSFDWDREIRTSDPDYYKWTQWIFLQLFSSWYSKAENKAKPISELISQFEAFGNTQTAAVCDEDTPEFSAEAWKLFSDAQKQQMLLKYRLTYLADTEVNWCPALGTVLANDEISNGFSERGGHPIVRKKMKQWSMRISAYAERLLNDLDTLQWPEPIKESQRHWIGKSVGARVLFKVDSHQIDIDIFTTRPDTIFGVTFMVLAPELELVKTITTKDQKQQVEDYIEQTAKRSERDRISGTKMVSGVFTGAYAIHPLTNAKVPIWISDYVLASYGTGAVMAVPCGDQRDYVFAKQYKIPIINIFEGVDISKDAFSGKEGVVMTNSDILNGLDYSRAIKKIISVLEERGVGKSNINYRMRDSVFSRQRYWGEPFPIYYVDGLPQTIESKYLPIQLPDVDKFLPTSTGEPPLANSALWAWDVLNKKIVSNSEINNKTVFPIELNTMPGWAGSSWYFYRYMDARNANEFAGKKAISYWKNVDLYIGGSEHATGHLLYSRFWQKFLFDLGKLPVEEYAVKLVNQGMILGQSAYIHRVANENCFISNDAREGIETTPVHVDVSLVNSFDELDIEAFKKWRPEYSQAKFIRGKKETFLLERAVEKMSKSKYNVVNPDEICETYGADTLRLYEMFLGPLEQSKPWSTSGITGVSTFLKRFWKLYFNNEGLCVTDDVPSPDALKVLHRAIKKVSNDIENFSFNTAVSTFMICVNDLSAMKCHSRSILNPLAVLISPFAPHIAEEVWLKLGHAETIAYQKYPQYNEAYIKEEVKTYPVSFNGKVRFSVDYEVDLAPEAIEQSIVKNEKTLENLRGATIKKVIVVHGKIINIVT